MKQPRSKKYRRWIVLLIIVLVIVVIRLMLPRVILSYSNKALSEIKGYYGHVNDIDLSIIRGTVAANGFYIDKLDTITSKQVPFISFNRATASVEWRSLLHGKIVAESLIIDPVIRFIKDRIEPEKIAKDTVNFRRLIKSLIPLKINRFEVRNGKIAYSDPTAKPPVDVSVDNINVLARNLSNVEDTALLPSSVRMDANVYGGKFNMNMRLDPLKKIPAFDLNLQLDNANLVKLNDFFKAYAKIDINKGSFGLYAEVAAEDRKFVGYVKPLIKDLDIVGPSDRKDSFLSKFWEGIVSVAESVLENPKKDQIAAKVPISGEYSKTSVAIWYSVLTVLRNAFIQALYPSIDFQINASTVKDLKHEDDKTVLKKVIEKPGGSKEKKKEETKNNKK